MDLFIPLYLFKHQNLYFIYKTRKVHGTVWSEYHIQQETEFLNNWYHDKYSRK